MWSSVCGSTAIPIESPEKLVLLFTLLDDAASIVYQDMENDRIQWQESDLRHELCEDFFTANAVAGRIDLKTFMSWRVIKEIMWYNENSEYCQRFIAETWSQFVNDRTYTVNFDSFCKIYLAVSEMPYDL